MSEARRSMHKELFSLINERLNQRASDEVEAQHLERSKMTPKKRESLFPSQPSFERALEVERCELLIGLIENFVGVPTPEGMASMECTFRRTRNPLTSLISTRCLFGWPKIVPQPVVPEWPSIVISPDLQDMSASDPAEAASAAQQKSGDRPASPADTSDESQQALPGIQPLCEQGSAGELPQSHVL